jgi:hypothetical protein
MSGNEIPTAKRAAVKVRDNWRCVRCGGPGAEWHHRRSRSVRDEHRHDTCNGVLLCSTCHRWVHAHPFAARNTGFIVSRHAMPFTEPVLCAMRGWVLLTCDGEVSFTHDPREQGDEQAHGAEPVSRINGPS